MVALAGVISAVMTAGSVSASLTSRGSGLRVMPVMSTACQTFTRTSHLAVKPPSSLVTVMVVFPLFMAVTTPSDTVATEGSELVHVYFFDAFLTAVL